MVDLIVTIVTGVFMLACLAATIAFQLRPNKKANPTKDVVGELHTVSAESKFNGMHPMKLYAAVTQEGELVEVSQLPWLPRAKAYQNALEGTCDACMVTYEVTHVENYTKQELKARIAAQSKAG